MQIFIGLVGLAERPAEVIHGDGENVVEADVAHEEIVEEVKKRVDIEQTPYSIFKQLEPLGFEIEDMGAILVTPRGQRIPIRRIRDLRIARKLVSDYKSVYAL